MKRQLAVLLLLLCLVSFSWSGTSGQSPNVQGQGQPQVNPGDITTTVIWTRYSSTAGRFSILFPGQPTLKQQPVDSAVGKLTNNILLASTGAAVFLASYADYPVVNDDPQAVLDRVRDGAVNGVKGTLIKSTAITHKGFPGREFQASGEVMLATFRIYLVNNRLYQTVAVGPPGAVSEAAKDFLNSFDLKIDK
jgi:hypothetical protein